MNRPDLYQLAIERARRWHDFARFNFRMAARYDASRHVWLGGASTALENARAEIRAARIFIREDSNELAA